MPRYHTKQNENYYTINRNLSKILSLFACSKVPFPPPQLPPVISLLPLFLPSRIPYNSLSSSSTSPFTPTTLLPCPSFTTARETVSLTLPHLPIEPTCQGCQKQPAAGTNRRLLGQYLPATPLGISLWMAFLNEISLDRPLTLTTQLSTSKLSDNPDTKVFQPHLSITAATATIIADITLLLPPQCIS